MYGLLDIATQLHHWNRFQDYIQQNHASALITRVISVIEPTIVIILSVLVGLVLLSVMMPLLGVLADIAM